MFELHSLEAIVAFVNCMRVITESASIKENIEHKHKINTKNWCTCVVRSFISYSSHFKRLILQTRSFKREFLKILMKMAFLAILHWLKLKTCKFYSCLQLLLKCLSLEILDDKISFVNKLKLPFSEKCKFRQNNSPSKLYEKLKVNWLSKAKI